MAQEHQNIINEFIDHSPVKVNSALVSAQNRVRLYWTNIVFNKPKNKHIHIKDIVENKVDKKYYLTKDKINKISKWKSNRDPLKDSKTILDRKFQTITARGAGQYHSEMILYRLPHEYMTSKILSISKYSSLVTVNENIRHLLLDNKKNQYRVITPIECERLQTVPDNYTKSIPTNERYKVLGNGWTIDVVAHILKGMLSGKVKQSKLLKPLF